MYYISILWCIPLVGSRQIFHHQTQYFSNEHVCLVQVLLSNAFKPILMKNKIKTTSDFSEPFNFRNTTKALLLWWYLKFVFIPILKYVKLIKL